VNCPLLAMKSIPLEGNVSRWANSEWQRANRQDWSAMFGGIGSLKEKL